MDLGFWFAIVFIADEYVQKDVGVLLFFFCETASMKDVDGFMFIFFKKIIMNVSCT